MPDRSASPSKDPFMHRDHGDTPEPDDEHDHDHDHDHSEHCGSEPYGGGHSPASRDLETSHYSDDHIHPAKNAAPHNDTTDESLPRDDTSDDLPKGAAKAAAGEIAQEMAEAKSGVTVPKSGLSRGRESPCAPDGVSAVVRRLLQGAADRETLPSELLWALSEVHTDEAWTAVREQYGKGRNADLVRDLRKCLTKEQFGDFRKQMQAQGVNELLPPDHDEPLKHHEKRNIVVGYAVGTIGCVLSIILDLTGTAEEISDLTQRSHCDGCPRFCDVPGEAPLRMDVDGHDAGDVDDDHFVRCAVRIFGIQHFGPFALPGIWMGVLGAVFVMCLLAWISGLCHTKLGLKVNYTRKITHCTGYLINVIVRFVIGSGEEIETISTLTLTSCLIMMLFHAFLLKPMRKRFGFCRTMFAGIDRVEDRPYTLRWLTTQNAAYFLLFIPLMYALVARNKFELMLIPVLVIGFGDGLAEPVGVKWGKHKYTVRAIWYNGRWCAGNFTRSYEGSAVVYIASVIAVLACYGWWESGLQVGVAVASMPILLTVAEAFGPHTWDNPFLLGVGGGCIILILATVP